MEGVLYFVEEVFYFIKWCSTFWVEHWHNKGVRSASAALWELDFRSRYSPGSIIIQLRLSVTYSYYSYYSYYYSYSETNLFSVVVFVLETLYVFVFVLYMY